MPQPETRSRNPLAALSQLSRDVEGRRRAELEAERRRRAARARRVATEQARRPAAAAAPRSNPAPMPAPQTEDLLDLVAQDALLDAARAEDLVAVGATSHAAVASDGAGHEVRPTLRGATPTVAPTAVASTAVASTAVASTAVASTAVASSPVGPRRPTPPPAAVPDTRPVLAVEAPTVEAALAEVANRLGSDVEIVEVERDRVGGVGGFFGRDVVRLLVRPGAPVPARVAPDTARTRPDPVPAAPVDREGAAGPAGLEAALEELTRRQELLDGESAPQPTARTSRFRDALGVAMGAATAAPPPLDEGWDDDAPLAPTLPVAEAIARVTEDAAERGRRMVAEAAARRATTAPDGRRRGEFVADELLADELEADEFEADELEADVVGDHDLPVHATVAVESVPAVPVTRSADPAGGRWCLDDLLGLSLPGVLRDRLRDAVADLDPANDLAVTVAVATAVSPWCATPPTGPQLLVGRAAEVLGEALDVAPVRPGGGPRARLSATFACGDDRAARADVVAVRAGRPVHLVLDGSAWSGLLDLRPSVVSAVGAAGLCDALGLAVGAGLALGYVVAVPGDVARPATPLDVALALRRLCLEEPTC